MLAYKIGIPYLRVTLLQEHTTAVMSVQLFRAYRLPVQLYGCLLFIYLLIFFAVLYSERYNDGSWPAHGSRYDKKYSFSVESKFVLRGVRFANGLHRN